MWQAATNNSVKNWWQLGVLTPSTPVGRPMGRPVGKGCIFPRETLMMQKSKFLHVHLYNKMTGSKNYLYYSLFARRGWFRFCTTTPASLMSAEPERPYPYLGTFWQTLKLILHARSKCFWKQISHSVLNLYVLTLKFVPCLFQCAPVPTTARCTVCQK